MSPSIRAPRMSVADRRAHIVDAAIPLILARGAEVTTRDIADAAGIAEGTVFRAFADKCELVDACITKVMDPADTIAVLADVDVRQPLEVKIPAIVRLLHSRVGDVVRFMAALGPRDHERHRAGRGPHRPPLAEVAQVVAGLLEPDADRLRVPVATAVEYLRVLVVGTSMPFLSSGEASDPDRLASFILNGIAQGRD